MPKARKNRAKKIPLGESGTLAFGHQKFDDTLYPAKSYKVVGRPAHGMLANPPTLVQEGEEESDASLTDASHDHDGQVNLDIGLPASDYHNVKVSGGRSAVARKVSADLNSDDEILVQMKQDGRTDRDIANTLKAAGRVNYNQKTIGSRWKRLRIALAAKKDKELDAGIANWLVADDQGLLQAIDAADQVIRRMKREADEEKWDIVARKLKASMPNTQYSKNACRDRFEALENKTAVIPPELHDDPLQREAEIQEARKRYEAKVAKQIADEAIKLANQKAKAAGERRLSSKSAGSNKKTTAKTLSTPASRSRRRVNPVQYKHDNSSEEDNMEDTDADLREGSDDLFTDAPSTGHGPRSQPPSNSQGQLHNPAAAIPPQISALSYRAQVASNADKPPVSIPNVQLKDINKMNRDELRDEAKARGLARDGVKAQLFATIKAARAGVTGLKQSPIPADPKILEVKKVSKPRHLSSASREIRRRQRSPSSSEPEGRRRGNKRVRFGSIRPDKRGLASISKAPFTKDATLGTRTHKPTHVPANGNTSKDANHDRACNYPRGSLSNEPSTRSRSLRLSNFPEDWTVQNIKDLFRAYAIISVQALPPVGEFIMNCAGSDDAKSAVSTYDGATIKRNKVKVMYNLPVLPRYPTLLQESPIQTPTAPESRTPVPPSVVDKESHSKATPSYMSRRLLASNVSPLLNAEDLRKIFVSATRCTTISPGKFYLDFVDAMAANKVMMTFDGHKIFDHEINLVKASAISCDTRSRQHEILEEETSDHYRY